MMTFILIIVCLWLWSNHLEEKETKEFRASVLKSLDEPRQIRLAAAEEAAKKAKELALISWHEEVLECIGGSPGSEFMDSDPEEFREEFELGLSPSQMVRELFGPSDEEKAAAAAAWKLPRSIKVTPRPRHPSDVEMDSRVAEMIQQLPPHLQREYFDALSK